MTRLSDVAYVRSKNAGPFWITVDILFHNAAAYAEFSASAVLDADSIGRAFGVGQGQCLKFELQSFFALKFSFPRRTPQGSATDSDMHAGQYFVRLLAIELDNADQSEQRAPPSVSRH